MNEGHVEYDKRLNWIGVGVCVAIAAPWYAWLTASGRIAGGAVSDHLFVIGVSALIGLAVHVSWQLLLYPYAVYKIRRLQGDTPKQALLYFLRFLVTTLVVGTIGALLAGVLMVGLGPLVFVLSVLASWYWDRERKKIRTIDVLSKSRELSLK